MAAAREEGADKFSLWLSGKLQDLNVDHEVYGTYISGILDSAETEEEKNEVLVDFLSEFVEEDVEETCDEIVQTWLRLSAEAAAVGRADQPDKKTVASVMEKQAATIVKKQGNEDNAANKQALLMQYAEVSDEEDEGYGYTVDTSNSGLLGFKNMNKTNVHQAEKQAREKAKEEVRVKREKDKMQREKDKQKASERKEKEKKRTQKGERRR
ncbi:coiled-coil domain-containing protein 43-like isoform X2 [Branchiostoma lanceolatum]|uniref:Coiled-coil domain-containing protein 43 n=1 Tax=Branchiostoma lanceolatum TaxID=7740 RepID=A0A8K0EVR2_BRALA|nr:CCDC43 [Branchiostoma lanceolatum]